MRGKERWENERVVKMMKRNGGGGAGIRGKRERSKEVKSIPGLWVVCQKKNLENPSYMSWCWLTLKNSQTLCIVLFLFIRCRSLMRSSLM